MRGRLAVAIVAVVLLGGACAHDSQPPTRVVTGGSPDVGKRLIGQYGCGSCHEIPGVKNANGLVGPPLIKFGRRGFIAGRLSNTPNNLIRWLDNPKDVDPLTDMPDLGVTPAQARDIAAYLEHLS